MTKMTAVIQLCPTHYLPLTSRPFIDFYGVICGQQLLNVMISEELSIQ